jgi:polysaccharide biosynthesis/export protein
MSKLRLKKAIAYSMLPIILGGCAPLVPSNYLGPTTIQSAQKVNGQSVRPRLIPLSAEMLSSKQGRVLLEPLMQPQPYEVGVYDNLNIIVWGHPEISTVATAPLSMLSTTSTTLSTAANSASASNPTILVQTDGTLFFPYVGNIHVSGLTIAQIQKRIAQRLSRYIRNPQVTVQVAKFRNRNIYVLGEVKMTSMQPLTDKPLSIMEAISSSGGINPNSADPSHIYVVRGSFNRPDIFWLDARTPQSLMIAARFPLQENDIVYVSAASLDGVNHFLNQILPSLTAYIIAKGLS